MKIRKSIHLTTLAIWLRRSKADCTTLAAQGENLQPTTSRVHHGARSAPCMTACFAALMLACIPAANAANLGRLFFTPEQRTHLDYAYARNAPVEGNASPFFTINGIVQKQGGARTVWVNGVSQNVDNSGDRTPTAQTVTLPGKAQAVRMKVGDKILLDQPAQTPQAAPAE